MRYPAYPEYSATRWPEVGGIPASWEARRLKFAVSLRNEKIEAEATNLEYMGLEHIESWTGKRIEDETASGEGVATRFVKDDVLFGKLRPYLAKVYLAEKEGMATTEALILKTEPALVPAFLKYLLLSDKLISSVSGSTYGAKMPRANWGEIGGLPNILPTLDEQYRITTFLDWKTGQIDALIAKKQELVEKLKEMRLAAITQAVTQGLDPTAPLRDSGIPWLGQVPAHWGVRNLKFCFDSLNNRRIPLNAEERANMSREHPYYGASGVIDLVEEYIFDEPLILIAEDGANLLARSTPLAFEARGKYWVNNHAHILRPALGPFAYWSNLLCIVQYDPWITGAAQPKLTKDNLGNIPLPCPSRDEQMAIAIYIETQTGEIDPLIHSAIETITHLTEYRTALITAATTGQIDVRQVAIPGRAKPETEGDNAARNPLLEPA